MRDLAEAVILADDLNRKEGPAPRCRCAKTAKSCSAIATRYKTNTATEPRPPGSGTRFSYASGSSAQGKCSSRDIRIIAPVPKVFDSLGAALSRSIAW